MAETTQLLLQYGRVVPCGTARMRQLHVSCQQMPACAKLSVFHLTDSHLPVSLAMGATALSQYIHSLDRRLCHVSCEPNAKMSGERILGSVPSGTLPSPHKDRSQ